MGDLALRVHESAHDERVRDERKVTEHVVLRLDCTGYAGWGWPCGGYREWSSSAGIERMSHASSVH